MPRIECTREADVLLMVGTGRWPERTPEELRAHVATCAICADLATVSSAIDDERAGQELHPLPSAGTMWWRAQIRARQDAAREVVRPITATQALAFAAVVGAVGAIFGATTTWFQDSLRWIGSGFTTLTSSIHVSLPSLPSDLSSVWVGYWILLLAVVFTLVASAFIVRWAFKED